MNPLGLALKYLDYMFECVTGLLSPNLSGWKLKAAASDHCHRILGFRVGNCQACSNRVPLQ